MTEEPGGGWCAPPNITCLCGAILDEGESGQHRCPLPILDDVLDMPPYTVARRLVHSVWCPFPGLRMMATDHPVWGQFVETWRLAQRNGCDQPAWEYSGPVPEQGARQATASSAQPEDTCGRCGGPHVPWTAPSPLWNQVMRGGCINGDEPYRGIVCTVCFAELAEQQGVATRWRMFAEEVSVPLQTVTPSGRTWDGEGWRWRTLPTTEKGPGDVTTEVG